MDKGLLFNHQSGEHQLRPVAVISINPDGVKVEPIIDVTKIYLAFFSVFGALFVAFQKKKIGKINSLDKHHAD